MPQQYSAINTRTPRQNLPDLGLPLFIGGHVPYAPAPARPDYVIPTPLVRDMAVAARFAAQDTARNLLPQFKGLAGCCRWLHQDAEGVGMWGHPGQCKASLTGLQSCASVWSCPVCAAKITERRRTMELAPGLKEAKRLGLFALHVTYTVQHVYRDELDALMAGLKAARKKSRSGKRMARLRAKYGYVGSIRSYEVTFGANGWHPHIHELFFCDRKIDRAALLSDLALQWAYGMVGSGLREVNQHGVKISSAFENIENYITKFGKEPRWGMAEEIGKAPVKQGRNGGRSPFQLLGDYQLHDDMEAGRRFVQYAYAMKSERQLRWSNGLKELLGVKVQTDVAIEADNDTAASHSFAMRNGWDYFGELPEPSFRAICADGNRGALHSAIASCDPDRLGRFLAPYRGMKKQDTLSTRLVLVGNQEGLDERDKLATVNEQMRFSDFVDPAIADGDIAGDGAAGIVERLRAREAAGTVVPVLERRREAVREAGRDARNSMPWLVLSHGRDAWRIAPNPDYVPYVAPSVRLLALRFFLASVRGTISVQP